MENEAKAMRGGRIDHVEARAREVRLINPFEEKLCVHQSNFPLSSFLSFIYPSQPICGVLGKNRVILT